MYQYQNQYFFQCIPSIFLYQQSMKPFFEIDESVLNNQSSSCDKQLSNPTEIQSQAKIIIDGKSQTANLKISQKFVANNVEDSDYQPEKTEKTLFYKKKNTESNLSNQIYSYISSRKSYDILMKLLGNQRQKVEDFYKLIRKIRKNNKKYMNRNYISDLILLKQQETNYKLYRRSGCCIQPQQIRRILRIIIQHFLINVCDCGLLTSKKMNKFTLMEHFARKREIHQFFQSQIGPSI